MGRRPGGELAARPLHFIWIADCSGSMKDDGKIQALNNAIRETIPHMQRVADDNPNAKVLLRAVKFSTGAQWHITRPTALGDFQWTDLRSTGRTDMGEALSLVAEEMKMPPMSDRALPPVLVLISDGQPTDNFDVGLAALLAEPWGRKAVRIAIAIGGDADQDVLARFIGRPGAKPLQANDPEALVRHIKWASTVVLQAVSAPASSGGAERSLTLPPAPETSATAGGAGAWGGGSAERPRSAVSVPLPPLPRPAARVSASQVQRPPLQAFAFDVVALDQTGQVVERRRSGAETYAEELGGGLSLEMVRIPAGNFVMGSPAGEEERLDAEGPPHQVALGEFFLGKLAVSQAQWRAVAALPQVARRLNPDPSHFSDDLLPAESVHWDDALEFCARLARRTGRNYRLPSEAEWEYACRAGTTTPFHFGPTITTDLVNYDGDYPYGQAPKGKYRGQTMPPGSFQAANAFGLFDMHGNVFEWCADPWHGDYQGAPADGGVWEMGASDARRLLRGGSWGRAARGCRSASRTDIVLRNDVWYAMCIYIGIRVACDG